VPHINGSHWDDPNAPHPALSQVGTGSGGVGQSNQSVFSQRGAYLVPAEPVAYRKSRRAQSTEDHETWVEDEVANTLNTFDLGDVRTTQAVVQPVAFAQNQVGEIRTNPVMGTLNTNSNATGRNTPLVMAPASQPVVCATGAVTDVLTRSQGTTEDGTGRGTLGIPAAFTPTSFGAYAEGVGTLRAKGGDLGGGSESLIANCALPSAPMVVRRLTPMECERLQGFPDDWTAIPYRGKTAPDGPRYKALGNSMAVPVMRWIGQRIRNA
jgi:DNA (cytosine-5)-methyltransferase 1